jgi:hypothetical protein
MAIVALFGSALAYYLNKVSNQNKINSIQKEPYILTIGLGKQNATLLKTIDKPSIIIEKDSKNEHIEEFKELGFGVLTSSAKEAIKKLNLQELQTAIISTGDDRHNISILVSLLTLLGSNSKKIYLKVENRELNLLFKHDIIKKNKGTDIIPYSINEIVAKELFSRHNILGNYKELITTKESFKVAIVGSSSLAMELIYHTLILSNLPNQNRLTLYLIDKDATTFKERAFKKYFSIDKIPHIKVVAKDMDTQKADFYKDDIWHEKNLTNIFIATNTDEQNLDIAINLQDKTYLNKITQKTLKTKIHFCISYDKGLSSLIDKDEDSFENFYVFGSYESVATCENIIDEKLDLIAKLINKSYVENSKVNKNELDKEWLKLPLDKKESNRSQASHIDIKLLSLGLKKVKSNKSLKELIEINKEIFEKVLPRRENDREFPKRFNTILSKLARSEHNRWNTFHFLNGWEYSKDRDDKAKKHNCLLPIEKFDEKIKDTYKYDVDSVVNIPLYLAHAGFEVVGCS